MKSAGAIPGSAPEPHKKPTSGKSKSAPGIPSGSGRDSNKVPFAAENFEHEIRRAMREKEKKRAKNPGLYL